MVPPRSSTTAPGAALVGRLLRSGLVGRAGWSFADQALSSLANAAMSVLMAKATGVTGYGYFAVAFTIYTFLLGVSRALASQPFLMRFAAVCDAQARVQAGAATGAALLFGTLCAVAVAPAVLLVAADVGPSVATMMALLPGLLVQDVWRSVFVARQRPRSAAANDALWTVLQFLGLGVAATAGVQDPVPLILIWGLTGWLCAALAAWQGGTLPSVVRAVGYVAHNRDVSRFLVAEWLTVLGAAQVALLLVGTLGDATDVGALRAAWTLLGPLTILVVGSFAFLVPELARRPTLEARSLRRVAVLTSCTIAVLTLGWGLGLLTLPEQVGRAVMGDVWPGARATLLAMTLWMVGSAVAVGPMTVIRACGEARPSFGVNVLIGVLLLGCTPAGFVLLGGAPGAAVGFAVANLVPAPLFWLQMERVLRRRQRPTGSS